MVQVRYIHNRSLDKLQFPGGYVRFSSNNTPDWHYYIQDYMGNVRMVVNSDGTAEQKTHYYPYGGVIGGLSTNHDHQLMKFEGKVLAAIERAFLCSWREDEALAEGQDRQFGLDWYDIHARQYDAIGVPSWNKVDALTEQMPWVSPYVFCGGDPVNWLDINGKNPIYGTNGRLLGVDEMGLQGEPYILREEDYFIGMDHQYAMQNDLGLTALDGFWAKMRFSSNYFSLSDRPDWDGKITLAEANRWYRIGEGTPLFVDASKIDLSSYASSGDDSIGDEYDYNILLTSKDGLVYGNLHFTRQPEDRVKISPDTYDFDIKPWKDNFWRNVATMIGSAVAGYGIPFQINFYGTNKFQRVKP